MTEIRYRLEALFVTKKRARPTISKAAQRKGTIAAAKLRSSKDPNHAKAKREKMARINVNKQIRREAAGKTPRPGARKHQIT